MTTDDRIIATDYYDGPSEGFARIAGSCFYFRRQSDSASDEVSNFKYLTMEKSLFEAVEKAVGAANSVFSVFVYSGSSDLANAVVDKALCKLRAEIDESGNSVSGLDFFGAMRQTKS